MHSHVPKEGFPPLGTTRFAISLPICSQKYVVRCASNHTCSQQLPTNSLELLLTVRMGRAGCGVGDSRRPTSMYGSLTPMPPPTRTCHPLPAIERRVYDQRIREVEHSSFVFSVNRGMGRKVTCFYKCLASMLAYKWDQAYSTTRWWLRCRLNFSLIRSAIQVLRGARSSQGHAVHFPASVDLVITESRIAPDS